ncbi:leucine rich repeat domain-containing protein [Ditylenchus destructor]|nr:leucine rich repeat domain-containing protein [Ditylenchus destructor]
MTVNGQYPQQMSQQTQECPQLQAPCRCAPSIYEPVAIICESAGSLGNALQAIQAAKNIRIDSLSIEDTAVSTLPANAFLDFTILRLVLNRNTLAQIDDLAFNGPLLDSLVELDLSDNQLQQIPAIGLPKLRNLRKLYLNRNRISTLQPQAFAGYASKEELSLETNALTQVPSQALEGQRNTLTNLNLGLNQIREVPVGALNFPQLNSLSLEFNGITMIIPQAFQQVPHLQYLYLTGNKFPSWQPEMFRYINELRTLGIGETPIAVIPANAFVHTPNLIRLEMSEAAVDTIEPGAFQRTPLIQAIVFNKNRLTRVRSDMFQGLNELYSLDLQGNRLEEVEPLGFANLPSLRHLDISYNQLQTMPMNSLDNSFEPVPNDRRVIYACANPWLCDSRLEWFRQLLRDNLDIDIDKPGCVAACGASFNNCPPEGTPLRAQDFCPIADNPLPLTGTALSLVGWIILAVIMTILLISICLMALIRYGMSHRRKKQKDLELEDEQRIMSSAASAYHQQHHFAGTHPRSFHSTTGIDLDLPAAHNLDDRQNYFI